MPGLSRLLAVITATPGFTANFQYWRSAFRTEAAADGFAAVAYDLIKTQRADQRDSIFRKPKAVGMSRSRRSLAITTLALALKLRIGCDFVAHGATGASAADFRGHGYPLTNA